MKSAIDEASEAEAARRSYFRLLAFSEAPQGRLRRPSSTWNTEERVAARVLDLLRLIHVTIWTHGPAAAPYLATLTSDQLAGYRTALQAIGATKQMRLLGLLHRHLIEPFANVDPSQRQSLISERLDDRDPHFWRAWYEIDSDELQQRLCDYLDAAPDQPLPPLPPHEAPHASRVAPEAPSTSLWVDVGRGQRHLFLLRESAAVALLDEWIANHPMSRRYDKDMSQPITSYTEAVRLQPRNTPQWGNLVGSLIGKLRSEGTTPEFLYPLWLPGSDLPMAQLTDWLAANFHWTLMRWTSPKESVLAWISDDEACADRFSALLRRHDQTALITAYRRIDALESCSLGLEFAEYDAARNTDGCGEAALIAAGDSGIAPWLVLAMRHEQGHWWRIASAQLPAHALHWTSDLDRDVALIVYRGAHLDAWRELWSRLGSDNNVAVLAVDGHIPIEALRERLVRTKDTVSIDNLRYLAGEHGWAYGHVWGGGSDEHYAMFFARDPAITARVAAFARERWPESWCRHGCW